jgi:transcription elongation factor Elf1
MSLPAAMQQERSLAAVLRELAVVTAAGAAACPWCGSSRVSSHPAETWPPQTVLQCDQCGSQLTLERRLVPRGARA